MDLLEMNQRHFVSYPKSGRTWLRFILHRIGVDAEINFHHDGFEFNDGSQPAHDFELAQRQARYGQGVRVVYLRRDPRDVMVSLFHQVTGRFDDFFHYRGTLSEFIRDPYFGAAVLARFRAVWEVLAQNPAVLVVEYEDCHRDLENVLRNILTHYELPVEANALAEACAAADLDAMRRLEASGTFPHPWLNPRNGALKVRRGRVGNYADELLPEDIAYLDLVFGLDGRPTSNV